MVGIPVATKPARSAIHPYSSPSFFCKIKLKSFPLQTTLIPYPHSMQPTPNSVASSDTTFHLDKLAKKSIFSGKVYLKVSVYIGRRGATSGVSPKRLLGKVLVPLDLPEAKSKACVVPSKVKGKAEGKKKKKRKRERGDRGEREYMSRY